MKWMLSIGGILLMILAIFASQTLARETIAGKWSKVFLFIFTAVAGIMGCLMIFNIFLE